MSQLFHDLIQTYDLCANYRAAAEDNDFPAPYGRKWQMVHIDILLKEDGSLISAKTISKEEADAVILVPMHEAAMNRTSAIVACPFNDKLTYLAPDFPDLPKKKVGQATKNHQAYMAALNAWMASDYAHPALATVHAFLSSGDLFERLVSLNLFAPLDYEGEDAYRPESKELELIAGYWVRFRIAPPAGSEVSDQVWNRHDFWQAWDQWLAHQEKMEIRGVCQVTGALETALSEVMPSVPVSGNTKAKLVSSNSPTDFTYRGRFCHALDALSVSREASHKAHATLNWLMGRQGKAGLLVWERGAQAIPRFDTADMAAEELDFFGESAAPSLRYEGDLGRQYATKLRQRMLGYATKLAGSQGIGILKLDAYSKGRVSLNQYQHMSLKDYLDTIEHWHTNFAWPRLEADKLGRLKVYCGAYNVFAILNEGLGLPLDSGRRPGMLRLLLDAILNRRAVPREVVRNCINRVQSIHGFDSRQDWQAALDLTCALIRGNLQLESKEIIPMGLDTSNANRSYLFGRLLAIADEVEDRAARTRFIRSGRDSARFSRALQLQRVFAVRPAVTWQNIHERLLPYMTHLTPGSAIKLDGLMTELMATLSSDPDFARPLGPEYLLGLSAQRQAFRMEREAKKAELAQIAESNKTLH